MLYHREENEFFNLIFLILNTLSILFDHFLDPLGHIFEEKIGVIGVIPREFLAEMCP